ncbi:hypothetical protein AK812_SmicGene16387 [Symbiodinium microadriaticum]|uniref:Uncharacterized protein n=1 Tax=Symbiodinium microadriaticum TaxID=2951 RepID=A0A1Q9E0G7_SYMMI|nr:hypothetical protein AK812_SmicGene16387 [Symbiodinium microadriaticum]
MKIKVNFDYSHVHGQSEGGVRNSECFLCKAWDRTSGNSFLGPVKHAHKMLGVASQSAWIELRKFVRQNVKVLYGTLISCNETADDMDWLYVKELMMFIGREHVMALAIGNEVELLHTQKKLVTAAAAALATIVVSLGVLRNEIACKLRRKNISDKCVNDIFEGGYFYTKVMHRANDLAAAMPGFSDVKLTTVMGGFILGGEPFVNTREARVLDFFTKINADFGRRWAWSFNTYPYFDPHIFMDPARSGMVKGAWPEVG